MNKIVTYVTRNKIIESIHESKCIVKDYNYKTIFSTNNGEDLVYPRSAIKIFQAIPFINSKAYKKFKLSERQIAISCASHYGEPEHLKVLNNWLVKIKIDKKILQCGIHNPLNIESSNKLLLKGSKPNQLHNNCAGKHLGMLSGCLMNNMSLKDYVNFKHPYQKLIRKSLELFTECEIKKIQVGVDGCSAPQYAFPLNNLSISMVNLIKHFNENHNYSKVIRMLLNAIAKYPHLTGSKIKYDTQLMRVTKGKMFSKWGAEGVLLFAHKEKKIGGVIKVKDGNERALPSVANEIFKKLSLLDKHESQELSIWSNQRLMNHAKIKVGEIYSIINQDI
jgi:L-asparaginase II